jgi:hypothetical protein
MSTDQPSQKQTDDVSPQTGCVVSIIGVLLLIVLLCGLLLRGRNRRQPTIPTQGNLTAVQSEPASTEGEAESAANQQRVATTPPEQVPEDASVTTTTDNGTSDAPAKNNSPARDESPGSDADSPLETASGVPLASLDPTEIDGVQSSQESPWQAASFSGKRYERALCMVRSSGDGRSQVSFFLRGKFRLLSGLAGLQDAQNEDQANESEQAKAIFRIYGDENLLWDPAPQAIAGATERFELDVQGVDYLTLVVEYGLRADGAQPAWADLRLARAANDEPTPNNSVSEP